MNIDTHPKEEIHWNVTASDAPECEILATDITVDVVVIGGGLTGCRTTLGLADAGTSVALLEAREIGFGASGRSGGQCNPIWRETPVQLSKRFGSEQADILVNTTLTAADDLFQDIKHFQIECDGIQNGWIQAAHTKSSRKSLEELRTGWNNAGANIDILEGDQLVAASGSPEYRFALFHKAGGNVQPLSLTRGYAKAAQARGAKLYHNSPVVELKKLNGKWHVKTPTGSVIAEKVIMTTNAYTKDEPLPGLRKTFLPLVSIALATAPLSKALQSSVLPNKVNISDSRAAIYFSRYDRDGRLIFGCVGSTDNVSTFGGHARLKTGLHKVFPQLQNIALERTWSGRIAVTPEMMPHVHEPEPGLLVALGFSGRGIAMTSVMGRALAAKALGETDHKMPFPIQPITPMPFHGLLNTLLPLGAPAMTLKDQFDKAINGI